MRQQAALAVLMMLVSVTSSGAQIDGGPEASPSVDSTSQDRSVIVIDFNVLFAQSAFGIRAFEERRDALIALRNENEEISRGLELREEELAARKSELSAEEFATLAEDFDRQANSLRSIQDEKGTKVDEWYRRQQQVFVLLTGQVLGNLLENSDINVVLSAETTVWYKDSVDATRGVLARVNELLGNGTGIEGYQSAFDYAEISGTVPEQSSDGQNQLDSEASGTSR